MLKRTSHPVRSYRYVCGTLRWLVILSLCQSVWAQVPPKAPPTTRTDNVKETIHGREIVDPYRWLEDQNSPETRAWIQAQMEYTQSVLGSLSGRDTLRQRVAELMKIEFISMPVARNGRYFFSKRLPDQELSVIYMRRGLQGKDEILVDPHPMSPDRTTSVHILSVSKDGTLLAYGVQRGGEDELVVHLFDVDARKDLPDQLPKARYVSVSIKPDKNGLYYGRLNADGPRLYYHAIGANAEDKEIFGKGYGPDKGIYSTLSEDGRYLLITVIYGSAAQKTEMYYQDLAKQGPIRPLITNINGRFYGHMAGDRLFVQTNWEAPNGRIIEVDLRNPERNRWHEVIPTGKATMAGFSVAGHQLFVNYLENVQSRVKVFEPDGRYRHDIAFPSIGTVSGVRGLWESNEAFFAFSSFHIPTTIYRYDVKDGKQKVWAQLKVPIQSDRLELKQVWYSSKDGTKVPMFLLHAKGTKLDGSNPTLLRGYGGFNLSETPQFSATAVLWAERGGVYALANLRGGGEFGEEWHKAGMLDKKQNVFDDFIAAAEWLVNSGYTKPSRLAILGGSNGGLLVGAALTQRPDLFQAVVCAIPLLDMVRYHKCLVAKLWVSEYGSSEDAEQFKYLYAYSPYHHVKPGTKYPAVLFVTGDSDTRVDPLHARKMTARLQSATGSDRPVLLHYDTKAGHAGGRPLNKEIELATDQYSFLFWQLGVPFERTAALEIRK